MKPQRTWVLIADAGRARVLENTGPGSGLRIVPGQSLENRIPSGHDLVSDQAPRAHDSLGPARHAMTGSEDPRRKEKRHFAGELADALDHGARQGAFDRLVLVAPPQILGDLRTALSPRVKEKVVSEVAKDLTKTPDRDVAGHLDLPFAL